MKKRLVFTVVTARASAPEQRQLLDGIISQAFETDIDVIVVSNVYNASEYNSFITHENSIYDIINSRKHDGIIFTDDSFMNPELRNDVMELIDKSGVPVVCIGAGDTKYTTVNSDTEKDIEKITDHLIDVHGFNDIDILTGPKENADSKKRVNGYRKSLKNHGIEFCEDKVIHGDFWITSGEKTAKEYADKMRPLPQAVLCTNDYMAYALCDTLVSRGIRIPEDVTVTGYEYIGGRTDHYPVLTTFHRNRKSLGRQAVVMLYNKINNKENESEFRMDGEFIPGDSCSCGADYNQISSEIREKKIQSYYSTLNDTGMLEQFLTESMSISDFIAALKRHSYFIPDLSGLYLCLYDDWCVSSETGKKNFQGKEGVVCYTISDIYRDIAPPVHFRRNTMFPDELHNENKPNAYYCCPVFFMDQDFGYMIVRYDKVKCFGESFRNWNNIVANALEFLRMKNDISYLMRCQNLSEFRDSLTGFNNRDGFVNEMNIALRNAGKDSFSIMIIHLNPVNTLLSVEINMQESAAALILGISEIIREISSERGKICARLDRNTFAVSEIITGNSEEMSIFEEKLRVRLYGFFREKNIYGDNLCHLFSTEGKSDFSSELEKAEKSIPEFTDLQNDSGYSDFVGLRSMIYFSPEKNITAEEACRKFCISSGYFRVMYKKYFGISFHQDCIMMRIMLAKYYLVSSKMNIASVSDRCCFDNEKYFMQQFRRITGYTPNQYRERFS